MAEKKGSLEQFTSALKNTVSALRDSVLFFLFVLLLFFPGTVKDRLLEAGFTKGNIAGLEWEGQLKQSAEQTKTVGEAVSKADETYNTLIDRLTELEKNVSDPMVRMSLTSIGADAKVSQGELVIADQALKRSLSTQQEIAEKLAPSSVPDKGWLFLGKVTENKNEWSSGSPETVATISAELITQGTKLTIRDDAYLRADSASGKHANASILSVVVDGHDKLSQKWSYKTEPLGK